MISFRVFPLFPAHGHVQHFTGSRIPWESFGPKDPTTKDTLRLKQHLFLVVDSLEMQTVYCNTCYEKKATSQFEEDIQNKISLK